MQEGLFYELGIILPKVRVEIDSGLRRNEFRFKLNNHEYPTFSGLERDEFMVNDIADRLRFLKIEGRAAVNPANGNPATIVRGDASMVQMCQQAGLTTWGPVGVLVLTLSAEIRKNAAEFQTLKVTEHGLGSLRAAFPELIETALKRFPIEKFDRILRELLEEEISIRDLKSILEGLLSIHGTTDVELQRYIVFIPPAEGLCPVNDERDIANLSITDYANFVRMSLKRYISHKYTRGSSTLMVYLLDREIEEKIGKAGAQGLTDEERLNFKASINREVSNLPQGSQSPVLLTTIDIRKTVRELVEDDFPNLAVLSYQELLPDMSIQPIARLSWDELPGASASP
jgi:type III secretion protein V